MGVPVAIASAGTGLTAGIVGVEAGLINASRAEMAKQVSSVIGQTGTGLGPPVIGLNNTSETGGDASLPAIGPDQSCEQE